VTALTDQRAAIQQPAAPDVTAIWREIDTITRWIDGKNGRDDREITLRIMKIGEEFGEVVAAHIGMVGQNPRKGKCATVGDLTDELCDVAITAMVALNTVVDDPHAARAALVGRIRRVVARIATAAPECPACRQPGRYAGDTDALEVGDRWTCECGAEWALTASGFVRVGEVVNRG
jgi:hypothetical protein